VIKFVSGFLRVLWFPPPIKTDRHDITEILLSVKHHKPNQTISATFNYLFISKMNYYNYNENYFRN
jgi:hypothetical protein